MDQAALEFELKMVHSTDEADDRQRNIGIREKSIEKLVSFVSKQLGKTVGPVVLDYVHTPEFALSWMKLIFEYLRDLALQILAMQPTSSSSEDQHNNGQASRQIGNGGTFMVFGLPGGKTTPVSNFLIDQIQGNPKIDTNIAEQFQELKEVFHKSKEPKEFCSVIRKRETERTVIDAFQFNELASIKTDLVYDMFNKTLSAANFRVDVAVFVANNYGEQQSETIINTVKQYVLLNRVNKTIVVCNECQLPVFYEFGHSAYKFPLSELNNYVGSFRFCDQRLSDIKEPSFQARFTNETIPRLKQAQLKNLNNGKPVIVLLGEMGVGKSTLGNCLVNQNASEELIRNRPFPTGNNVAPCINRSSIHFGHEFVVIDAVGFGDRSISQMMALNLFRDALALVDYNVDLMLLVSNSGRAFEETIKFYEVITENLLKENALRNTVLVCNKCEPGWFDNQKRMRAEQEQKAPEFYRLLDKFQNRTTEFNLEFPILKKGISEESSKNQRRERVATRLD